VKHNQVNGESNRDGTNNNYSFNFGIEGETEDESINQLRRRVSRNLMATLLLSSGIPMITAGDERGKTQTGNNNAYCQDTQMSWVNHDLEDFQRNLETTTAFLIKLRAEHPALRPKHFANYEVANEQSDRMRWFNAAGELMTEENWHDSQLRTLIRLTDHQNSTGQIESIMLIIHGAEHQIEVRLPEIDNILEYELLWDSSWELPEPSQFIGAGSPIGMEPLSVSLLKAHSHQAS
jgi:glycogen debranching enzyme